VSTAAHRIIQSLLRAEAEINLLARCQPSNWAAVKVSLREQWLLGKRTEPVFEFAPRPDFSRLRGALESLATWLGDGGPWSAIWAERARELVLEAEVAESVGETVLVSLARRRFSTGRASEQRALKRLARCWASLEVEPSNQARIESDDDSNPGSLVRLMRAELTRLQLPFPVRISTKLVARAAVDDTAVWLKPRELLLTGEAKRIVAHEVHGHVVRRFNGRHRKHLPFRCGVVSADLDEEGRALWMEAQLGYLDVSRKVELGRRHMAALACRQGAPFGDGVELLLKLGAPLDDALAIALRVWRGGGIAREILYLTGYLRAARHLRRDPGLDDWMKKGRLSFEIASRLRQGQLTLNAAT